MEKIQFFPFFFHPGTEKVSLKSPRMLHIEHIRTSHIFMEQFEGIFLLFVLYRGEKLRTFQGKLGAITLSTLLIT